MIDVQNDFCTEGSWADYIEGSYSADRAPIAPLQRVQAGIGALPVHGGYVLDNARAFCTAAAVWWITKCVGAVTDFAQ